MLARLKYYFRIYFLIEAQYIKSRMQYRDDFLISTVGMFFASLTTIATFWVLLSSIPNLAGWTFDQLVFIYAFYLLAMTPMQIIFDHFWQLRFHVQRGTFLKYYFRPMNMMFYYTSDMFDIKGIMMVVLGIVLMVYSSIQLDLTWTFGGILMLLVALFSSSLVTVSTVVMSSCTAFWIYNSYPVMDLARRLRDFSPYPMTIFDGFFKFLLTYIIPIGFIAFYPSQYFLDPGSVSWLFYLTPIIGLVFFWLTYKVWTAGVNNYTGTGS